MKRLKIPPTLGTKCVSLYLEQKSHESSPPWEESALHINILELKAVKLAILAFTKNRVNLNSIHIQMDNMVALTYLVKMGGTSDQTLVSLSKQIWNYLISKQITLTAEHLPGILNVEADFNPGI